MSCVIMRDTTLLTLIDTDIYHVNIHINQIIYNFVNLSVFINLHFKISSTF